MKVRQNKRRIYRATVQRAKAMWPDWLVICARRSVWVKLRSIKSLHMMFATQRAADAAAQAMTRRYQNQTERT